MELNEIVAALQEKNAKLRTLHIHINEEKNRVEMGIDKYRKGDNGATEKQIEYIKSLPNTDWQSNCTLRQMNKWCASAIIDAAKEYEDTKFYIYK